VAGPSDAHPSSQIQEEVSDVENASARRPNDCGIGSAVGKRTTAAPYGVTPLQPFFLSPREEGMSGPSTTSGRAVPPGGSTMEPAIPLTAEMARALGGSTGRTSPPCLPESPGEDARQAVSDPRVPTTMSASTRPQRERQAPANLRSGDWLLHVNQ